MEYSFNWSMLINYYGTILMGIRAMLIISGAIIGLAMAQGLFLCLVRMSGSRIVASLATVWVELFRNVPRIVILLWVYYCSSIYLKIEFLTAWQAAVVALSIQEGAYTAEIFRAGIEVVDKGEVEAGRSLGLSYLQIMHKIVIPQAVRTTIPALTNELVFCIKTSTIASIIGVGDLLYYAKRLAEQTFHPIEFYGITAFIYFLLCYSISRLANWLNKKMAVY